MKSKETGYKVESLDGEDWRPVVGFEGYYSISNLGRVKSLPRQTGFYFNIDEKIINGFVKFNGYKSVDLYGVNGREKKHVHRLVAEAFVYNEFPETRTEVNHKDENKLNNHANNLEWCTSSENKRYGTLPQRMRDSHINNPKTSIPVVQYSIYGDEIKIFKGASDVERQTGLFSNSITRVCKGKTQTCGGYKWGYLSERGETYNKYEQIN